MPVEPGPPIGGWEPPGIVLGGCWFGEVAEVSDPDVLEFGLAFGSGY